MTDERTPDRPDPADETPAHPIEGGATTAPPGGPGLLAEAPHFVATYDAAEGVEVIEEALGERFRLTDEGPQLLVLVGEDLADGWMPLHDHHTVVQLNEGSYPFLLTPAAARALGFRTD